MSALRPEWLYWPQTCTLLAAFAAQEAPIRFVGGAVRDALLGIAATEVDAATPLTPEAVTALLEKAGIRAIPTGIAHGTVTALTGGTAFEITTLRKDVATDGRHAQVAFTDDWQADAQRRDFTMNALYLSPEGELFDYFGGEADARAGHVRFIGNARARIGEDYLRILRFFRFYARYGKGEPDAQALAACASEARHIASLSGERVAQELLKLLAADTPLPALGYMQESGALAQVLGFAVADLGPLRTLLSFEHIPPLTRLAALLLSGGGEPQALCERLRLSNAQRKSLTLLSAHIDEVTDATPPARCKQLIRALGNEIFSTLVCLRAALAVGLTPALDAMLDLAMDWRAPTFPVTGEDLKARGFTEGKALGETLGKLEAAWEASDYALTKEALLAQL